MKSPKSAKADSDILILGIEVSCLIPVIIDPKPPAPIRM